MKEKLTEELKLIIEKCKNDPKFFISNYCVRPDDTDATINVYQRPKQSEIIDHILNDHYVIINSSRQVGKTTLIEAFILWLVIFHKNYTVAILTKNSEFTVKIISEIMTIFDHLPTFFKKVVKLKTDNARTKVFSNFSRIESIVVEKSKPENAGRGSRAGFIFVDEAAFIEYMDEVYSGLEPVTTSIHKNYKSKGYPYGTVISSTPNGVEGIGRWYYQFWTKSQDGMTGYTPIVFHWRDAGYTDEEMQKQRIKMNDELKFIQEYELVFLVGQSSLLDVDTANELQKDCYKPVSKQILKYNYTFSLYKNIDPSKIYIFSIDSASETGTSDQAILLLEYDTGTLIPIGEGYGKIPIIAFTNNIIDLVKLYFNNMFNYFIIVEKNYLGESIIGTIREKDQEMFEKIYTTVEKKKNGTSVTYKGIQTNTRTKNLMIDALSQYLNDNRYELAELIMPEMLKRQILSLQYNRTSKKLSVPAGMKDDLVMAFSFALYAQYFDQQSFNKYISLCKLSSKVTTESLKRVLTFYQERYG